MIDVIQVFDNNLHNVSLATALSNVPEEEELVITALPPGAPIEISERVDEAVQEREPEIPTLTTPVVAAESSEQNPASNAQVIE